MTDKAKPKPLTNKQRDHAISQLTDLAGRHADQIIQIRKNVLMIINVLNFQNRIRWWQLFRKGYLAFLKNSCYSFLTMAKKNKQVVPQGKVLSDKARVKADAKKQGLADKAEIKEVLKGSPESIPKNFK